MGRGMIFFLYIVFVVFIIIYNGHLCLFYFICRFLNDHSTTLTDFILATKLIGSCLGMVGVTVCSRGLIWLLIVISGIL